MINYNPFNPSVLARGHLIAMLMVYGRSLQRAAEYLRELQAMNLDELRTELERVENEWQKERESK